MIDPEKVDRHGTMSLTEYRAQERIELGYEEFDKLFEARVEKLREIGRTKGRKYTKHTGDRLCNFKEEAETLGTTPEKVLHTFYNKHWRAIEDYINNGSDIGEELVENHITDAIMYLFLLEGLIAEKREA